jgi:hypothetical protein
MYLASLIAVVVFAYHASSELRCAFSRTGQSHGRKSRAWYHKLPLLANYSKLPFLPTP